MATTEQPADVAYEKDIDGIWREAGHIGLALEEHKNGQTTNNPPIDTKDAVVANDVDAFVRRFIVLPSDHAYTAIALWIMHTYVFDVFDVTPYLRIESAERRSGKSRVLEVLETLSNKPIRVDNVSTAALYRMIESQAPTLLFDETDAIFTPKKDPDKEELRGLLNSGFRRGAVVWRVVGSSLKLATFKVYGPKALAGLKRLPDTIEDRCIKIRIERRKPDERIEKYRIAKVRNEAQPLRAALDDWAEDAREEQKLNPEPVMPEGLNDRQEDAWEPLISIADTLGSDWAKAARTAAEALSDLDEDESESHGILLLRDVRSIVNRRPTEDAFSSELLVNELTQMKARPWAAWRNHTDPMTVYDLTRMLREYRLKTKPTGKDRLARYRREDFEAVWSRYLTVADPATETAEATEGPTP